MKKGKQVSMDCPPPLPSSSYQVGKEEEEAKARSRHNSLMMDYLELQKEIEAKRKKLSEANRKKHNLSTVVKFLRRKFKSFSKKPSQRVQVRVRKHSLKLAPLKDTQEVQEASVPSTTPLFDLNQLIPNGDDMNDIQVEMGPPGTGLSKMSFVNGDVVKLAVDKRKISWQDQIAIRA
ncbi:uncharacterized protein M6B38_336305 [Iris pallida]|uniref:Uncharacterized protein n=1 Tax=Iris pallida TaxID=29817 RepID=A0AAX6GZM0_IRIPA|nr:uncharacterized protein M6B38_336305 [Iris pallida]